MITLFMLCIEMIFVKSDKANIAISIVILFISD